MEIVEITRFIPRAQGFRATWVEADGRHTGGVLSFGVDPDGQLNGWLCYSEGEERGEASRDLTAAELAAVTRTIPWRTWAELAEHQHRSMWHHRLDAEVFQQLALGLSSDRARALATQMDPHEALLGADYVRSFGLAQGQPWHTRPHLPTDPTSITELRLLDILRSEFNGLSARCRVRSIDGDERVTDLHTNMFFRSLEFHECSTPWVSRRRIDSVAERLVLITSLPTEWWTILAEGPTGEAEQARALSHAFRQLSQPPPTNRGGAAWSRRIAGHRHSCSGRRTRLTFLLSRDRRRGRS